MNRNAGKQRGSRGRSPATGHGVYRQKSETPVTVDGSSGNRISGSGYANNERTSPVQAWVKKPAQVSYVDRKCQDDVICSTTEQPDQVAALKISGDENDLLKSNTNLSRGPFVSRESEDKNVKDGPGMRCGLVNQMKDVSLSCNDSVSSTSDLKVENSSLVVDQKSAHKSGDAGNSSNESNTRPFDIVLETKGIRLKPSLQEMNRAKREANKGYTGIVIRPGMVLLKKYLSINDQVMIVNKCRQLGFGEGGFYQPGYRDGALLHLKMMCLGKNWDPETSRYGDTRLADGSTPPKIPVEFSQFVEKAVKESQSLVASKMLKEEDGVPSMSPDICIVNFYTTTGRLGLHQDKDESRNSIWKGLPVVSFSIGDSAEFLYSDQRDDENAEKVLLESGDVLIFGGKSRNVFHGVRSIRKDTAPKVLVQETSLRPGRLNLTFRQY